MIKLGCRNKTCLIKKGRFFKMTNDIITIINTWDIRKCRCVDIKYW